MDARRQQALAERSAQCLVEAALSQIDGKWKGVVLYYLLQGTLRFNELRRRAPGCTQRMMTNQLRELEADGLITRKVYAEVPPKVEYSLTPKGRSLEPVITGLRRWAQDHLLPQVSIEPAGAARQSAKSGCPVGEPSAH